MSIRHTAELLVFATGAMLALGIPAMAQIGGEGGGKGGKKAAKKGEVDPAATQDKGGKAGFKKGGGGEADPLAPLNDKGGKAGFKKGGGGGEIDPLGALNDQGGKAGFKKGQGGLQPDGERFDVRRLTQEPLETLRSLDYNGNGYIDPAELPPQARSLLERLARTAEKDLDFTQPMPIQPLVDLVINRAGGPNDPRNTGRADATKAQAALISLVPGFATDAKSGLTPGFDVPRQAAGKSAAKSAAPKYSARVIEYVDNLLKKYDRNKDEMLEQKEWRDANIENADAKTMDADKDSHLNRDELLAFYAKRLGASTSTAAGGRPQGGPSSGVSFSVAPTNVDSYARSLFEKYDEDESGFLEKKEASRLGRLAQDADTNGDGLISLEELIAKLAAQSAAGDSSAGGAPPRAGFGATKGPAAASADKPQPLRYLTALDKLPKGIPAWFLRADLDGDCQVSMAEYSPMWTDAKAEEFMRLDTNGDGFISPAECMAGEKKPAAPATPVAAAKGAE